MMRAKEVSKSMQSHPSTVLDRILSVLENVGRKGYSRSKRNRHQSCSKISPLLELVYIFNLDVLSVAIVSFIASYLIAKFTIKCVLVASLKIFQVLFARLALFSFSIRKAKTDKLE